MRPCMMTLNRLRRSEALCVALLAAAMILPGVASAQYGAPEKAAGAPAGDDGLPPFLKSMKRRSVTIEALRKTADGQVAPVPADTRITFRVLAQGTKVRDYFLKTGPEGKVTFEGVPINPDVQQFITYKLLVQHQGVEFPFEASTLPAEGEGGALVVTVNDVTTDLSAIKLQHTFIEVRPQEDYLLVGHRVRLVNTSATAVNLRDLPDGGLRLTVPEVAKHPETHEGANKDMIEVLGRFVFFKGAVLPGEEGAAEIPLYYTIPYGTEDKVTWSMTAPVDTVGASVLVWRSRQPGQRADVPLTLNAMGVGAVEPVEMNDGKRFWRLAMDGATLAAGQPFSFELGGVPAEGGGRRLALGLALLGVLLLVLVGFRRAEGTSVGRISRAHLEAERDRLVRALARMRKAHDRGRMTATRYDREREAITARLATLYRTLDRLEAR